MTPRAHNPINVPCAYCGAPAGDLCRTVAGRRPGTRHADWHRARTAVYAELRRLLDERAALVDALTRCDPLGPDAESEPALRALEAFDTDRSPTRPRRPRRESSARSWTVCKPRHDAVRC